MDASGNLYIADPRNERVRVVAAATGIITTVAGSTCPESSPYPLSTGCYGGDGGPATSALLNGPYGVALDSSGRICTSPTPATAAFAKYSSAPIP